MFDDLGEKTLRNGQEVLLGKVTGPDEGWTDRLLPFLGHKGGHWARQVESSLKEDQSPLRSHYYVALDSSGEVMATVGIFRTGPVGEFGHVFTAPEHRRKGLADTLCRISVKDFAETGGEALLLGTGYDSPPYHIYRRAGFESVIEGSGFMAFYRRTRKEFLAEYYAPSDTETGPVEYGDWAPVNFLLSLEEGGFLRLPAMNHNGRTNFESSFVVLMEDVIAGRARCCVSRSKKTGSVTAVAVSRDDVRFHGSRSLDAFAHPEFIETLAPTVNMAIDGSNKPVMAFLNGDDESRMNVLGGVGFEEAARVPGALEVPPGFPDTGERRDLFIMAWNL